MDDEIKVVDDGETAEIAEVLAKARGARTLRGLPRPQGLPAGGWYSRQPRKLTDGSTGMYLFYRWHPRPDEPPGRNGRVPTKPAKCLGRLN